jgi:hypothetical protein
MKKMLAGGIVGVVVLLLVGGLAVEAKYMGMLGWVTGLFAEDPVFRDRHVSSWIKQLKDEKPEVRREAARVFGEMSYDEMPEESNKSIHAALMESACVDEDPQTICLSAYALSHVDKLVRAKAMMSAMMGPGLLRGIQHSDPVVRQVAARALGEWEHVSDWAVPYLKDVAERDEDESVRKEASVALEKIGTPRPRPPARGGPPPFAQMGKKTVSGSTKLDSSKAQPADAPVDPKRVPDGEAERKRK